MTESQTHAKMHQIIENAVKNFDAYTSGYEPDASHVEKMTAEVEQIEKLNLQLKNPPMKDLQVLAKLKKNMGMTEEK